MICKFCRQDKEQSEFYSYRKRGRVYYRSTCKICYTALKRNRYKTDDDFRNGIRRQSIQYAHSLKGRIKRREANKIRHGSKKFKRYHQYWENHTERGRVCRRKKQSNWLKTDGGKFYSARKHAKRRSRININADLTRTEWTEILKKYLHKCAYCGSSKKLTQDHIIPLSKGGHHTANNVVPACHQCNSKKGNQTWKPKLS